MTPVQFEYEIRVDEYAAAQSIYYNFTRRHSRTIRPLWRIFAGIVLIVAGGSQQGSDLASLLLAMIGAWWVYAGIALFFPAKYFRRAYKGAALAGEVFKAVINEKGLEITCDKCAWQVTWPGVTFKAEDKRVFVILSYGTLFIFGKKYLNSEQEKQIRELSGLPALR